MAKAPVWNRVFRDEFGGTEFDPAWSIYKLTPTSKYNDKHITLENDRARIQCYADEDGVWRSGGMSLDLPDQQVYGSFRVRCRLEKGAYFRGVCLLWADAPEQGEIDFFEIGAKDPNRKKNTQTLHYDYGESHKMIHTNYVLAGSDFTVFHNIRVDWMPGLLVYMCDGKEMARVTDPNVTDIPMHLALQTGLGKDAEAPKPGDPPGSLWIEWVEVYTMGAP